MIRGPDGSTFVADISADEMTAARTSVYVSSYSFDLSNPLISTPLPVVSLESDVVGIGVCYAIPSAPLVIAATKSRILLFDATTLTHLRNISFETFRSINVDPFTCDIVATFLEYSLTTISITADGSTMSAEVPSAPHSTSIIGFSLLKFNNNTRLWSPSWLSYAVSTSAELRATAFDPRSQVLAAMIYVSNDETILLSFAEGARQTILNPVSSVTDSTIVMTIDTPSGNMIAYGVIGGLQFQLSLIFNPITSMFDLALPGGPALPQWDPPLNFIDGNLPDYPIFVSHFASAPPRCAGSFFGPISLSLSLVCVSHLSSVMMKQQHRQE